MILQIGLEKNQAIWEEQKFNKQLAQAFAELFNTNAEKEKDRVWQGDQKDADRAHDESLRRLQATLDEQAAQNDHSRELEIIGINHAHDKDYWTHQKNREL